MSKSLQEIGIHTTILTPFPEEQRNIRDVHVEVVPSMLSKIGLSSLIYKLGRKMALSKLTGKIFVSEKMTFSAANSLNAGLKIILKKNKFDLIHAAQQHASLATIPVVKEFNIPLVADFHNIWEEDMAADGYVENYISKRLHALDQHIMDSADAVTLVSEFMKEYLGQKFSVNKNPHVVVPPGGFIDKEFQEIKRDNKVVYAGMVSHREHVDLFARSIKYSKSSADFYISNYGENLSDVKKITRSPGYPVVNYIWFRSRSEVLQFLKHCKIGIVTSRNDVARQLGPPLKLFEYLSCGVPVVANDIGGWCDIITKEQVGLTVPDDPKSFAEAIDTLLRNDDLWQRMHARCLEIIKTKYNWERYARELLFPLYAQLIERDPHE